MPRRKRTSELCSYRALDQLSTGDRGLGTGPGPRSDGLGIGEWEGRYPRSGLGLMKRHRAIATLDLNEGTASYGLGRHGNDALSIHQPLRRRKLRIECFGLARYDVLGPYLLDLEKGHDSAGSHPQQHLHADNKREPLMQLAAEYVQPQLA